MRYTFIKTLPCIAVGLGLVTAWLAYADDATDNAPTLTTDGMMTPRTRAVVSGDSAYLLGPVETVADNLTRIGELAISSDRGSVLFEAHRSRPYQNVVLSKAEAEASTARRFPELNLMYWDVRTRTARTLLREQETPEGAPWIREIQWIPQTRIALMTLGRVNPETQTITKSLMRIDTVAGTVRRMTDMDDASALEVSPWQPFAFVMKGSVKGANGGPDTPPSLRVITLQGLGRVIPIDAGTGALQWGLDGKSVYATKLFERTPEGRRTSRNYLTLIDLETGSVTHPAKLPTFQDDKTIPSPYAGWTAGPVTTNVTVQGPLGQVQETTAVWVRGVEKPAAVAGKTSTESVGATTATSVNKAFVADALLVATNAKMEGYLVNQDKGAVLFTRDGSLCAAPIFRVSRIAFEQGIRGVQRGMAMTNAKQVGLGILQYAQDYDENFPKPGSGLVKKLQPYLKSDSVFKNPATGEPGFVYTYTGATAMAEIDLVAETQLGYITGPGGKAVIWADGHVTWQDDPVQP
jgi:hypothetical protein